MLARLPVAMMLLWSGAAPAQSDEIAAVPARAVIGHSYAGDTAASQIRFINVRSRPVRIYWIGYDGGEHPYALLDEGEEFIQPTFVAHRWLARDANDGTPLQAFISTRSAARDSGTAQIALIR